MIAFSIIIAVSLSVLAALSGIAHASVFGAFFDLCWSLVERCVSDAVALKVALIAVGLSVATAGLIYAMIRAAARLTRLRASLKRLPIRQLGSISVIEDVNVCSAFTHGLLSPRIYLSRGLIRSLSTEELRAVFAHEMAHARTKDPLRLLALSFLKDAFFYLPIVSWATEALRYSIETKADDRAKSAAGGLALASALVKLASGKGVSSLSPLAAGAQGKKGADTVLRIKRLVDEKEQKRIGPSKKSLIASAAVALALFVSFGPEVVLGQGAKDACAHGHCAMHSSNASTECKTHCAI